MISIVVPVYKVEKYIERCMRSIVSQTCRDFEVIVVDDGSPDRSIQIAEDVLSQSDIPYTIITSENKGVSAARNLGFEHTNGDYIVFIDSDDYISESYVETYNKLIADYPMCDLLFANYSVLRENKLSDNILNISCLQTITSCEAETAFLNRNLKLLITTMLLKKEFILKNDLAFDPYVRYSEDVQYIWRAVAYTDNPITISDKFLYYYIIREGSTMTSSGVEKILSGCEGMERISQEISPKLCDTVRENFVSYWYLAMLHGAAKNLSRTDWLDLFNRSGSAVHMKKLVRSADIKRRILAMISIVSRSLLYYIFAEI